ncbi:hypothetical protein Y032_0129g1467 [Ancylostoma ceylanicum]|uniref:Secreted protein n=1 Tax=Ancylostoma ceylanicum TaxID=53326 RepID=A0A016T7Q3_9BILA|nr:hypothetical protein Y032_0129g1467 [Ancylostoma ceylanicum]
MHKFRLLSFYVFSVVSANQHCSLACLRLCETPLFSRLNGNFLRTPRPPSTPAHANEASARDFFEINRDRGFWIALSLIRMSFEPMEAFHGIENRKCF